MNRQSRFDTECLGLVHWDDSEGWYGEGCGRGVQDGEHMYTVQASHCPDFSSCRAQALGTQASAAAARWLSSCGARAQFLHGMWNLPRPRIEPVYFALQGGFLTTGPPGKPHHCKNFVCPYINRTHNSLCCKGKYHFK